MILILAYICSIIPAFLAAPSKWRVVDMTYTLDETTPLMPGRKKFERNVIQKGTTPKGYWVQYEDYVSGTHAGTHLDAPAHYKKGGLTVDQIPLSSLIAPAAVIDVSTRVESNPDTQVTVQDLLNWEFITGQSLNGTILLMRTGWGKKWNDPTAFFGIAENNKEKYHFPGFSREAAQWLVDNRNILGIGTEAKSLDSGLNLDVGRPVHQIVLGHGLFGIENIANMDQIPISGAILHVLPIKIGSSSGAPARISATFSQF